MATNINTILSWFKTGLKPTQTQFWATWASFWHKDEQIPQSSINNLVNVLNKKTENDQFNAHKTDANAHNAEFKAKEDKNQKGIAGGYAPLDLNEKIPGKFINFPNAPKMVVPVGDFLVFKVAPNAGDSLEIGDSVIGYCESNFLCEATYYGGDTSLMSSFETEQQVVGSIINIDRNNGDITYSLRQEILDRTNWQQSITFLFSFDSGVSWIEGYEPIQGYPTTTYGMYGPNFGIRDLLGVYADYIPPQPMLSSQVSDIT